MKPPHASRTTSWGRGTVTKVLSKNKVTVDGVLRHVLDIQRVSLPSDEEVVDEVPQEESDARLGWRIMRPTIDLEDQGSV